MLKETFITLIIKYNASVLEAKGLWQEIETNYNFANRHYHTLLHLENLLYELIPIKDKLQDWDVTLFALYYHDVIYDPIKKDNEEQSAVLAEKRMTQIGVPNQMITNCNNQILATAAHANNLDMDTNYFTDADLSILGQNAKIYEEYCNNIRNEYAIYNDADYNNGRKNVVLHFLQMQPIFKTDYFYNKYKMQAKQNLQAEIEKLNLLFSNYP
jgi:predicted metal-dependent HD superfamily phosphohydrolase